MSTVGQLLSPCHVPSPSAPCRRVSPPPSPSRGIGGGVAGKRQGHSLLPPDSGLPASFSSLPRNLILGVRETQEFSLFLNLMSSLGAALNSWAHLRAGPVLAEAPLPSAPQCLPWGCILTILSPFLHFGWDFLPQSPWLGVSWGQFGLNPRVHILRSCPLTSG